MKVWWIRGKFDIKSKKKIFVNLHAFPVCGCWCVQEFWPYHSIHGRYSFPALSGRQLLSVHWMQSALSVIHCLTHSDWLAFLLRGKTGQRWVGLSWAGISRSFHTTSHWMHIHNALVWMLKHRLEVRAERRGNAFGCRKTARLLSSLLCHWLPKALTHLSKISITEIMLLERGDIPSIPNHRHVLYPSKGCIQASSPPIPL